MIFYIYNLNLKSSCQIKWNKERLTTALYLSMVLELLSTTARNTQVKGDSIVFISKNVKLVTKEKSYS